MLQMIRKGKKGKKQPVGQVEKGERGGICYRKYSFNRKEGFQVLGKGIALGIFTQWVCYESIFAVPVAVFMTILVWRSEKKRKIEEEREKLRLHFKEFLSNLYSSVCAGYSLENAVRTSLRDMTDLFGPDDRMVLEIKEMIRLQSLKKPADTLFRDLGERSGIDDIYILGEILGIVKRTGGSMEKILRECKGTIDERIETRKEIDAVMAAKRYEMKIMTGMPAGILLYIRLAFPGFSDVLYKNLAGVLIMTGALGVYLLAIYLGCRVLQVKGW